MDETLYLYTERRTVKARNLAADPRLVVHLESAQDVLIVRGTAEDLGTPAQVPEVVAALSAKYPSEEDRQYLPAADPAFERRLRHQTAVGEDVAPARFRGLTAPVDIAALTVEPREWADALFRRTGGRRARRAADLSGGAAWRCGRAAVGSPPGAVGPLVLFHLIQETARHAGHADIIRETLDGRRAGQLLDAYEAG